MDRLETLLEFLKEDPDDSFSQFAIASEYVKLGRLEDARTAFERLVRGDPGYVGTYWHLGKLYEMTGQSDLAVQVYKQGIEVATDISDMHSRSELQAALLEAEGFGFD